ncbi:MAG: hypothetical protein AAF196_18925 [Planctomycetota bacterium]
MSDSSNSRSGPLALAALIRLYEDSLQKKELRVSTLRTYRSQWVALTDYFGPDYRVDRVDASGLEEFLRKRIDSGQTARTTARHDCEAMIRLLRHASEKGLMAGEVPDFDVRAFVAGYGDDSFPSVGELGEALATVRKPRDRDRVVSVYVFMATVRELGRIQPGDWDDSWLTLRDGQGRERRVPLLEETRALLDRMNASSPSRPFPVASIEGTIRRFRERRGRKFGATRLMKSLGRDLLDEGVPKGQLLYVRRGAHARGAVEPKDPSTIRSAMRRILRRSGIIEPLSIHRQGQLGPATPVVRPDLGVVRDVNIAASRASE